MAALKVHNNRLHYCLFSIERKVTLPVRVKPFFGDIFFLFVTFCSQFFPVWLNQVQVLNPPQLC